jgi:U3 small nucleolar ribonucleoprotein protein IMP4
MRVNRGTYVIKGLVKICQENDISDLIILHEHKGEPDGMIVCHLPFGPTAYFGLNNVILRHDLKEKPTTMSEAFPHLIFDNFNTKLGERVSDILKYIFPLPKVDSKRVLTFANNNDYISFRHHVYQKENEKDIQLKEVGPRFELKPYQISLGTIDQPNAKKEWVLRPYMNTAKKRKAL